MAYDVYSMFDLQEHKKHFVHYFETVMFPDGHIEYAVPSHQEKLISTAMRQQNKTRKEILDSCPKDRYGDFLNWLCDITGCAALWENYWAFPKESTSSQDAMFQELIAEGLIRVEA